MKLKHIFFALAATALFSTAQAQVKVGANPGTISTNAVLDVEGTSGTHSVILQNGNMGVGTNTPTRKLDVNGDLRIQSTTTAPTGTTLVGLGIDPATGNVYRTASTSAGVASQKLVLVKSGNNDAIPVNNTYYKYTQITSEVYDPNNLWSNNQFTAPYTGKYILTTTGIFYTAVSNQDHPVLIRVSVFVNGTNREGYENNFAGAGNGATNVNTAPTLTGVSILELNAGDIVDLRHLTYNNAGNIATTRILSLQIEAIPN